MTGATPPAHVLSGVDPNIFHTQFQCGQGLRAVDVGLRPIGALEIDLEYFRRIFLMQPYHIVVGVLPRFGIECEAEVIQGFVQFRRISECGEIPR